MAEYYVAPEGDDSASGSSSAPWFSIQTAGSNVSAGDTIVVRDGRYDYGSAQRLSGSDGTTDNPITLRAADEASPVFSFDGPEPGGWGAGDDGGVKVNAANWTLEGLEIEDSPYYGLQLNSGANGATVRNCVVHDSHLVGIGSYGADDLTITDCRSYDNTGSTSDGGDSDGIQLSRTNGAVVRNCTSARNSDDGYDFWESTNVLVDQCRAEDNGSSGGDGNGFKMGGGDRSGNNVVRRSVAWNNDSIGFTYNAATEPVEFYNNTSWENGQGYYAEGGSVLKNNLSDSDGTVKYTANTTEEANSWNLNITDPAFVSTDPSSGDFLRPARDSPCVDAGVDVGLAFTGEGPDVGYLEAAASQDDSTSSGGPALLYHDGSGWQEL